MITSYHSEIPSLSLMKNFILPQPLDDSPELMINSVSFRFHTRRKRCASIVRSRYKECTSQGVPTYFSPTSHLLALSTPEKHYNFFGCTKTVWFEHENTFQNYQASQDIRNAPLRAYLRTLLLQAVKKYIFQSYQTPFDPVYTRKNTTMFLGLTKTVWFEQENTFQN